MNQVGAQHLKMCYCSKGRAVRNEYGNLAEVSAQMWSENTCFPFICVGKHDPVVLGDKLPCTLLGMAMPSVEQQRGRLRREKETQNEIRRITHGSKHPNKGFGKWAKSAKQKIPKGPND
ncbi:hypothetical protein I7I51_04810 [Histoplasma capsulatum]|uniref:Uncharacterized protein n=1 Tax=Ajellomyces capsulatus TaxID=5037 RepID=A0A8A1M5U3_AJECA|nr:hypothetical protein I7I51_04810 [Histoplasma capsulatum]